MPQNAITIKAPTALMGRLSLSVGWENGPERGLKTVSFNQFKQNSAEPDQTPRLMWVCTICQCPSPDFTDNPLYTALWRHVDKNSPALNNRFADFVRTRVLILLVSIHVENNLKENLMYIYFGSIVNTEQNSISSKHFIVYNQPS